MAKFYGTIQGNRGMGTRLGTQEIRTSAQSWDGSIITKLYYDEKDLNVIIATDESSSPYGEIKFNGKFKNFQHLLELVQEVGIDYAINLLIEKGENKKWKKLN